MEVHHTKPERGAGALPHNTVFMKKSDSTVILGHDLPKPRLTLAGALWCILYLVVPVLTLGSLLDALAQWWLGWCLGL